MSGDVDRISFRHTEARQIILKKLEGFFDLGNFAGES
jgi:hypothetical protein